MEQLVLSNLNRLPDALKIEVLHFVQFLVQKTSQPPLKMVVQKSKRTKKLVFADFHFPENGQTFSRSEIYGDN